MSQTDLDKIAGKFKHVSGVMTVKVSEVVITVVEIKIASPDYRGSQFGSPNIKLRRHIYSLERSVYQRFPERNFDFRIEEV